MNRRIILFTCILAFSIVFTISAAHGQQTERRILNKRPEHYELHVIVDSESGKYGYRDYWGKVIIRPKYDSALSFSEGLAVVRVDNKRFFINKDGNASFDWQFDGARTFSEGLAAVCINEKWGYIDKQGIVSIPLQYEFADSFSDGVAIIGINSKFGLIDKDGIVVLPIQCESIKPFSEGLAAVKAGDRWGYIDKTGKFVIEPKFDSTGRFSEGRAWVSINRDNGNSAGYQEFYIDKTGNRLNGIR